MDTLNLIPDVVAINFEKYVDELAVTLSSDLAPKKVSTILGLLHLIALFNCTYPRFFRAYFSNWVIQNSSFLSSIKQNSVANMRHILKFILEAYLVGFEEFLVVFKEMHESLLISDTSLNLAFVLFYCKLVLKYKDDLYWESSTLKDRHSLFVMTYHEKLSLLLQEKTRNVRSLHKKNRSIYETKGDLTLSQSSSFIGQYSDLKELVKNFTEFCALSHIDHDVSQWDVEEPKIEEGRLVFLDNKLSSSDLVACFLNDEEYRFYHDLSLPEDSLDEYGDVDSTINYMKAISSKTDIDYLAKFFITNATEGFNMEKLVDGLLDMTKIRFDLIPYIARFIAFASQRFPESLAYVSGSIYNQSIFLIHKKIPIVNMRNRISALISEFVKFSLVSQSVVFAILRRAVDDMDSSNSEFVTKTLEGCGKYLYYMPESRRRMENLFRIIKKNMMHLLPSEISSLEVVMKNILGLDADSSLDLEPVESLFVSFIFNMPLSRYNPCEMRTIIDALGINYIVESLLLSRAFSSSCNINMVLKSLSLTEYHVATDILFGCLLAEIDNYPHVDKQLMYKILKTSFIEILDGRLAKEEIVGFVEFVLRKGLDGEVTYKDWTKFLAWFQRAFLSLSSQFDVHLSTNLFSSIYPEGNNFPAKDQVLHEASKDSIDESLDDYISKLSISAIDERKVYYVSKDESMSFLDSPKKSADSERTLLLRNLKSKKLTSFRRIS